MEWGKARFTAPAGYTDRTNYLFQDKNELEAIQVAYGRTNSEEPDLAAVMHDRINRLRAGLGDAVKVEPAVSTQIAGLSGLQTFYEVSTQKGKLKNWLVIAMQDPRDYFQVSYQAPSSASSAPQTFEHIKKSVAMGTARDAAAKAPGYVRRTASWISLDVPKALEPPPVYLFVSQDGGTKISVSEYDPLAGQQAPRSLADEISSDTLDGSVLSSKQETTRTLAGGYVTQVRYLLTNDTGSGNAQQLIVRARLRMENNVTISLRGASNLPAKNNLDQDIAGILESAVPR
jgi:hypothetical protein